ncbi:AraC family transcriptional regulator [Robertkochia marina]|uniref:AraC family transcriptional regulator n=1 Tax=Robertkochia marina TaxID=1227945 RepID=A0A4S3LZK0_9FLAO|nr:GyrI-like domain-containing protein [Robertkochia marina]THD67542.1 AraC family transcriptional regulator [Robertkochia marina]TRZ44590.1 AraC family transcriptional regulator [Robertkochia marina]
MTPVRLQTIAAYKMFGIRTLTTLTELDPSITWKTFMPLVKHLHPFRADENLYAIQKYTAPKDSSSIDPGQPFEFWAAVRLDENPDELPGKMEECKVDEGLYAVFIHKGSVHTIQKTMEVIMNDWLPGSGYETDDRHHLQVMAPHYKGPMHPEAEEEVWIPVRKIA